MDALDATPLCPAPVELQLDQVVFVAPELVVTARARRRIVACPACGHASARVHSRYRRSLADLPWHGLRVRLDLRVRRFFCDVPGCSRRIFTERLPKTAGPYARRTQRAATALQVIALALGGRPGARLAGSLGLPVGVSALLAPLKRDGTMVPAPTTPGPRVLGVDDWAWRKGQRYGTILVDLERHAVTDLLPDRESATLAAWLRQHPGVEFISRDRAGAYAEGAARGAPQAIQIADRFHLLRNLTDAVQHVVVRHHAALQAIGLSPPQCSNARVLAKRGGPVARPASTPRVAEVRKAARRQDRRSRYDQVLELHRRGQSIMAIHRRTGLSRATIMRWLRAGQYPEPSPRTPRSTSLTPHAEHLRERWDEGCHNATRLWRELRADRGFHGGVTTVRDWVGAHLRGREAPPALGAASAAMPASAAPVARIARPSARRASWLLTAPTASLTPPEVQYVQAVARASPPLATVHALAVEFRRMLLEHDANAFSAWLAAADQGDLRGFAASIRRDRDAVLAAIVFRWSNGQVEGQVNRLKLVKRTMYGRASFPLLRRRVVA
jgi:transposase